MVEGCNKNAAIVHCLLKCWTKALNDCEADDACLRLKSVFAEGAGAIDVEDEAFGQIIAATDFDEYDRKWRAATIGVDTLSFSIEGEPEVSVEGDCAIIRFHMSARGTFETGAPIEPPLRWRGMHEWRKHDGEWRIVRERLVAQ